MSIRNLEDGISHGMPTVFFATAYAVTEGRLVSVAPIASVASVMCVASYHVCSICQNVAHVRISVALLMSVAPAMSITTDLDKQWHN